MVSTSALQRASFLVLLVIITLAFVGMLQDFLQPLFWAAILATFFYPVYCRGLQLLGDRPTLVAIGTIAIILCLVILPLGVIGLAMAREAIALYQRFDRGEIELQSVLPSLDHTLPWLKEHLLSLGIDLGSLPQELSQVAVSASKVVASQALTLGQNTVWFSVLFILMVYLLFFFLRDGQRIIETLVYVLPFGDKRERYLLHKFAETSRATLKGTLVVGVVQGLLGGVTFWLLGIRPAVLWGGLMAAFSLLPTLGAAVVWVPAAVWLLSTGHLVKGLILIGIGTFIISLVDNVLRPILVGRDTRIPDYLIVLATLGGIAIFGLSGFILGPIMAALFLAVWEMFAQEQHTQKELVVLPNSLSPPRQETEPHL